MIFLLGSVQVLPICMCVSCLLGVTAFFFPVGIFLTLRISNKRFLFYLSMEQMFEKNIHVRSARDSRRLIVSLFVNPGFFPRSTLPQPGFPFLSSFSPSCRVFTSLEVAVKVGEVSLIWCACKGSAQLRHRVAVPGFVCSSSHVEASRERKWENDSSPK